MAEDVNIGALAEKYDFVGREIRNAVISACVSAAMEREESVSQTDFEKTLPDTVKTRAEKYAIIQTIKKLKLNDYNKIRFIENYTGFKVQ